MTRTIPKLSAALLCLLPAVSRAHPGHGAAEADSPLHYFAEPEHALLLGAALVAGVVMAGWLRAQRARRRDDVKAE